MIITINAEKDDGGKIELSFSDHALDNDAFVNMWIGSGDVITIPIHELMPSIIAFDAKRSKRLSEEAQLILT